MRRWMLTRNGFPIFAVLLLTAVAGCTEPGSINSNVTRDSGSARQAVSVSRLGQDLGLDMVRQSSCYAMLRNESNVVMVYPDPQGQVYVNGQPVGQGGVFVEQGELYVPYELEGQVRSRLRCVQAVPPPPRRTTPVYRSSTALVPLRPASAHRGQATGDVVVDPGHGGKDPGTSNASHTVNEKCVVLDVGLKLARNLQGGGVNVTMTRNNDTFIELNDRAALANQVEADLFVAVHADSAPRPSARGFTVYISTTASGKSLAAARAIERSLSAAGFPSNGIKRAGYRVLVKTDVPAVLVELGYMTNAAEAAQLADPSYRTAYAQAISDGILDFLDGQ